MFGKTNKQLQLCPDCAPCQACLASSMVHAVSTECSQKHVFYMQHFLGHKPVACQKTSMCISFECRLQKAGLAGLCTLQFWFIMQQV